MIRFGAKKYFVYGYGGEITVSLIGHKHKYIHLIRVILFR